MSSTEMDPPEVSVVILAFGDEPYLFNSVSSTLDSSIENIEVLVVDNGCRSEVLNSLPRDNRLRVIRSGKNLGFAGGVNRGFDEAKSDLLVMLNSDALIDASALRYLKEAIDEGEDLAGAVILLPDGRVNSAGNPLHLLGLSWSGHYGESSQNLPGTLDSAILSGACLAIRRSAWERLGGFPDEYFAYMEDCDLSWRARQLGMSLRIVHNAVVTHYYEFSRNRTKMYLIERNRIIFVLTTYQTRTILLLAIPFIAFEIAILAVAIAQGWGVDKLRAQWWILQNLRWIRSRRRSVQQHRSVSDSKLKGYWVTHFDPGQIASGKVTRLLERMLDEWWSLVSRFV